MPEQRTLFGEVANPEPTYPIARLLCLPDGRIVFLHHQRQSKDAVVGYLGLALDGTPVEVPVDVQGPSFSDHSLHPYESALPTWVARLLAPATRKQVSTWNDSEAAERFLRFLDDIANYAPLLDPDGDDYGPFHGAAEIDGEAYRLRVTHLGTGKTIEKRFNGPGGLSLENLFQTVRKDVYTRFTPPYPRYDKEHQRRGTRLMETALTRLKATSADPQVIERLNVGPAGGTGVVPHRCIGHGRLPFWIENVEALPQTEEEAPKPANLGPRDVLHEAVEQLDAVHLQLDLDALDEYLRDAETVLQWAAAPNPSRYYTPEAVQDLRAALVGVHDRHLHRLRNHPGEGRLRGQVERVAGLLAIHVDPRLIVEANLAFIEIWKPAAPQPVVTSEEEETEPEPDADEDDEPNEANEE